MALPAGTRLGPYEILSLIGAGGMGEVYRTRDTRLDRVVAIKVLPPHLSDNAEVRQRFEREARAVSSLSHPHICPLYDIGHQDGTDFLVMEFLEGETLAQRVAKGPLPPGQLLKYAIETADALEKAHRQGVIHRDLKPGNIMLTKSGAKLLDFGLAKARAEIVGDISSSPTQSRPLTATGTIVGTFQYMAPEQLEGREADARSDIFAFGAVLHEMATGQKAFAGQSQASVIAAILRAEPQPISSLQPMVPPALDRVVKTCLAKDPDERWQTAHDLKLQLEWIAEGGSQAGLPAPVVARRKSRERFAWGIAAAAALTAVLFAVGYFARAPVEAPAIRSYLHPPVGAAFRLSDVLAGFALSPDGRRLAFVAVTAEGNILLWVRALDSLTAQPLPGTDGAAYPFWSPDSHFVGFFADGKLKKVEASGGPPLALCAAPNGRGGTWNQDGVILFAPDRYSALQRVSAAGGTPSEATVLDPSAPEQTHRWPFFLPDGRHFLYVAAEPAASFGTSQVQIRLASLDSKQTELLLRAASHAIFASGYLLFLRENSLMAQRIDPGRLSLVGEAFPMAEQVDNDTLFNRGLFSASQNGILGYSEGSGPSSGKLMWNDRSGKELGSIAEYGQYLDPRFSPDGKRVAFDLVAAGGREVWVYDLARAVKTRLTFGPEGAQNCYPVWSPDGKFIAYTSIRGARSGIYQKASDGSGSEETLLPESPGILLARDWSPDGRFISYLNLPSSANLHQDVWILPLFGDRKAYAMSGPETNRGDGRFSPDGKWIAFTSFESGRAEVHVTPFPGPGGKWQVSTAGGSLPIWRRDGKEVFFLSLSRNLMVAEVQERGAALEIGTVHALFDTRARQFGTAYDVSPDGQKFVITTRGESLSGPITLVVNWTAGLKK